MNKDTMCSSTQENQSPQNVKEEVLLQIPDCLVELIDKSEPLELALILSGDKEEIMEKLKGEKTSSTSGKNNNEIDWQELSPKLEEYKSGVAKAIAEGTGHIIKGILTCSNSYSQKVTYCHTYKSFNSMILIDVNRWVIWNQTIVIVKSHGLTVWLLFYDTRVIVAFCI